MSEDKPPSIMALKCACTRQTMLAGPNKPASPAGTAKSSSEDFADPVMARSLSPMAKKASCFRVSMAMVAKSLLVDAGAIHGHALVAGIVGDGAVVLDHGFVERQVAYIDACSTVMFGHYGRQNFKSSE